MSDLSQIAIKLGTQGPVKVHPTARLVQILFAGDIIVRTTNALYVWEHPYYPQFYIPAAALLATKHVAVTEGETFSHPSTGAPIARQWTLHAATRSTDAVIAFDANLDGPAAPLAGLVRITFDAMDGWFEEDTPAVVHPKDPFKRVDVLFSRRRVVVSLNGHVLADSDAVMHLHETGLPCRYYLPLTAVATKLLRPSEMRTKCPYKGEAEYYSIDLDGEKFENLAWYYRTPRPECAAIADRVCFYNEKVDITIDGKPQPRPSTHFDNKRPNAKPAIV